MPRSSQPAANDPQSRSPATSNAPCISGARTKAKPSRPIVAAIAAKKSVIRTPRFKPALCGHDVGNSTSERHPDRRRRWCDVDYSRMIQFQTNPMHTGDSRRALFSCDCLTHMQVHSRPTTTMIAAANRVAAAVLAVIVLGITTVPTRAGCNPADRINAQCYADLQTATAAALAANQPLWLPAGTYTLQQELVIDYSPLAATGFQIISDGAVIDATAIGQRAMSIECSGGSPNNPKGCFYFHIQGTLFVNANTSGAAVRFGLNDFSDAHNSAKIDHLIVNNAGSGYA